MVTTPATVQCSGYIDLFFPTDRTNILTTSGRDDRTGVKIDTWRDYTMRTIVLNCCDENGLPVTRCYCDENKLPTRCHFSRIQHQSPQKENHYWTTPLQSRQHNPQNQNLYWTTPLTVQSRQHNMVEFSGIWSSPRRDSFNWHCNPNYITNYSMSYNTLLQSYK